MTVAFDRDRVSDSAALLRDERARLAPADWPGRGWEPAHREVAELCATPPTDIAGVLTRLTIAQKIFDDLPPRAANRVAAFNSLYFTITDRVAKLLTSEDVKDPVFLELLAEGGEAVGVGGHGAPSSIERRNRFLPSSVLRWTRQPPIASWRR